MMNRALIMIALASANGGISMRVVEPMLPRLAEEFGATIAATAGVITSFAIGQAIAQYVHGPIGDRYGRLQTVTALLCIASFMSFGCAFSHSLNAMIAWRFAMALFSSGMMVLGLAFLADVVPPAERQPIIARFVSGTIIGQALGPFLGGVITDLAGWRANFMVIGAVFGTLAITMFVTTRHEWVRPPSTGGALLSPGRYIALLHLPKVRMVLLAVTVEMALFYGAFAFLGVLLKEKFDLSFTVIGTLMAGFGIGGLLYIGIVRLVLARLGQRGCVVWGGIGSAVFFGGAVLTPFWPIVMLCTIGLGFSFYLMHNTLQMKATEMAPHARGTGLSIFSMGWASGQAIGPVLVGVSAATFGYAPMIALFGCALAVLGFVLRANLARL